MSALSGSGVTDVDVILDCSDDVDAEVPAMDGSAVDFHLAMAAAGLEQLGRKRISFPDAPFLWSGANTFIRIDLGSGRWFYRYESIELWPYRSEVVIDDISLTYALEVAPARTFLRESELVNLDDKGLAKGIERTTALVVGQDGPISETRLPNELVTHKLLDLVGDLYLTGIPARYLDVEALRSGHAANVRAAKELWQVMNRGIDANWEAE